MHKLTAADPITHSPDLVAENIEALKSLFPEAFTEGKIDFDVLKQFLGGAVDERDEKYGLNWFGKRQARQLALTPSTGTLRPCPADSVDWATTQNLMIEGDNLEVLKLLQKSYAGKVKLIYIDPPYNTGKDFVYKDDFHDSIKNYKMLTGQVDSDGRSVSSNTEASGRFHTDWLNMMYPRLRLARNLLRDDGVIVVSIDDNEVHNLRVLLDEIFGEENRVESFVWKKTYGGGAKERYAVTQQEYALLYARAMEALPDLWLPPDPGAEARYYKYRDDKFDRRGPYRIKPLEATKSMDRRENLVFAIPLPWGGEVWPRRQWWWGHERVFKAIAADELVFTRTGGSVSVSYKQYLRDENGIERRAKPFSVIDGIYTQQGTADLEQLFGGKLMLQFPKPVSLIKRLASTVNASEPEGLILDFFSGSSTTAQAVLELNRELGGRCQFIMVQLPEPTPIDATAYEEGYTTVADIGKERIRRVIAHMREENAVKLPADPATSEDLGFRVFKLDYSNIRTWEPDRNDLPKMLEESVEHIKTDRSEQDILYELLLKLGLDLCVPIETRTIAGQVVHSIGAGVLIACLSPHITAAHVEPLALGIVAWHKAQAPAGDTTVVLRDSAFPDDVAKTNLAAILQQHGITNVRSL